MIRDTVKGYFKPGSHLPTGQLIDDLAGFKDAYPDLGFYLESKGWETGLSILVLGPPRCGKTSLGVSLLKVAWEIEAHRQGLWKEYDYLEDLRRMWRMEEMTQRLPHDHAVWREYVEWESVFRERKDRTLMVLDAWCEGYSQNHWYESTELVRYRRDRDLSTIVTVSDPSWAVTPEPLKKLLQDGITVTMPAAWWDQ